MKEKIQLFCESIGLDTVGFIPCRRFEELIPFYEERENKGLQNAFEEKVIDKRIDPSHYMEDGRTIISIAFPYCDIENPTPSSNGFSIYTQRLDYHQVVKSYLEQIINYIKSIGGKAIGLVDSNALPERYIAYLAGLGFIGKNNMLITEKYGSYVFLGEIITDLEIVCEDKRESSEIKAHAECGTCEKCLRACPPKSINRARSNPNICLSYITQKKDISDQEIKLLKGNVFGCDFCQYGCPYNEGATLTPLSAFKQLEEMTQDMHHYAQMDNNYFKSMVQKTSCGWRGKNVIKRNAIIALKRAGGDIAGFKGESPYINDYIKRLDEQE